MRRKYREQVLYLITLLKIFLTREQDESKFSEFSQNEWYLLTIIAVFSQHVCNASVYKEVTGSNFTGRKGRNKAL